ncbi:MAG: hypothetical protein JW987_06685 [Anaerolineaceae bacterium]|nr:hypothetical protein [Anaerolineaceae bacterium]
MKIKIGKLEWVMIAATAITTVIHLVLGFQYTDVLFLLNAAGFVGLLGAYLLPWDFLDRFRQLARWALAGYSALTIVLYVMMNGSLNPIGITSKIAEVVLLLTLMFDPKKR